MQLTVTHCIFNQLVNKRGLKNKLENDNNINHSFHIPVQIHPFTKCSLKYELRKSTKLLYKKEI